MKADIETRGEAESRGIVDAADRILRELIRTPKFKETVIILLNSIDPPAARRLVRTLFWQDPGLLMSIMGSLPAMVNVALEAMAESAAQMNAMPPPLLKDLLGRIVGGIDGAAAGEAAGGLLKMLLSLDLADKESGLRRSLFSLASDFSASCSRALEGGDLAARLSEWMARTAERARDESTSTHAFIQAFNKALSENPAFAQHVIKPLLETPAKPAARKTATKAGGQAGEDRAEKGRSGAAKAGEGRSGATRAKKGQSGTGRAEKK